MIKNFNLSIIFNLYIFYVKLSKKYKIIPIVQYIPLFN